MPWDLVIIILMQFCLNHNNSPWTQDESCVIHVSWPFAVTKQGNAITEDPLVTIGKLTDVTETFSPSQII